MKLLLSAFILANCAVSVAKAATLSYRKAMASDGVVRCFQTDKHNKPVGYSVADMNCMTAEEIQQAAENAVAQNTQQNDGVGEFIFPKEHTSCEGSPSESYCFSHGIPDQN